MVLDGRVGQAKSVGGSLLRTCGDDRRHDAHLAVGRAVDEATVGARSLPHASSPAAANHSSRPSMGIV
jgi:hypothetical protein